MKCFVCHTPIQHAIQKIDPQAPPDCVSCHTNAHSYQVDLFTGENGYNTEKTPSVMFMNGINCKGCHIFHEVSKNDIQTTKAGVKSCEKCHGPGYDKLVTMWQDATSKRLQTINAIYKTVAFQVNNSKGTTKEEAQKLLDEAYHNIRVVEVGKSVHNVTFADKLLLGAYDLLKKSLTMIGSSVNLPTFISGSDLIPNECYSCHSGIQEISVRIFDMNFSHNQHIVKERIVCAKCHSNAQKHGELIVSKSNCNSCHHSEGKTNDVCAKCHALQSQVFSGNYLNKNQPDYMKGGGVNCIDCHADGDKIIKPDSKICLKCHDDSYRQMEGDWKNDVNKLLKDADASIKDVKDVNLTDEQQAVVNETKKIINDVNAKPSIYVHNYDLLSSALTSNIKKIKKFK